MPSDRGGDVCALLSHIAHRRRGQGERAGPRLGHPAEVTCFADERGEAVSNPASWPNGRSHARLPPDQVRGPRYPAPFPPPTRGGGVGAPIQPRWIQTDLVWV